MVLALQEKKRIVLRIAQAHKCNACSAHVILFMASYIFSAAFQKNAASHLFHSFSQQEAKFLRYNYNYGFFSLQIMWVMKLVT